MSRSGSCTLGGLDLTSPTPSTSPTATEPARSRPVTKLCGARALGPAFFVFAMFAAQTACAEGAGPLLARALSCRLTDNELVSFPATLSAADPASFAKPTERHGAPTFDLFTLAKPVTAFGHAVDRIALQPGRVLALVPLADKAEEESRYSLKQPGVPYSPDEKALGDGRRLVAYTLEGTRYETQIFVGCQYEKKEASAWGVSDDGLSALLR